MKRLAPFIVVMALIVVWELVVRVGWVDELLLPAPTQVAQSLWEDRDLLWPDLLVTTWEVLVGLVAALVLGTALAVAMHLVPWVDRALRPLIVGSQAVPIPVIAPLIVLILGFGLAPKILIIALICFFPVTINVADGLRDSDPDARKLLRSLDATRWQRLRFLEAPSALPATFTGMKVTRMDGRQHHLVGVQPTHPVKRTLAGIRAGRDEELEVALDLVRPG